MLVDVPKFADQSIVGTINVNNENYHSMPLCPSWIGTTKGFPINKSGLQHTYLHSTLTRLKRLMRKLCRKMRERKEPLRYS